MRNLVSLLVSVLILTLAVLIAHPFILTLADGVIPVH